MRRRCGWEEGAGVAGAFNEGMPGTSACGPWTGSSPEISAFLLCARGAGEGMTSGVRPSAEEGGDAGEPGVGGASDARGPVAGG